MERVILMNIIATYIDGDDANKHAKALHAQGKRNVFVLKNIDTNRYSIIIEKPIKESFTISTIKGNI